MTKTFEDYINDGSLSEYEYTHTIRFIETWRRMEHLFNGGEHAVELGGISLLARYMREHRGVEVSEYVRDLREPLQLPDAAFDAVLMLEVLEHLKDRDTAESPIEEIAMFTRSGAISCLREVNRILKPGGYLILTTPNACSVDAMGRILLGLHPFQYEPHVREYAPRDVRMLAEETGFSCLTVSTFFSWNALPGFSRDKLIKVLIDLDYDASDRGDDMFCLLQKPPSES